MEEVVGHGEDHEIIFNPSSNKNPLIPLLVLFLPLLLILTSYFKTKKKNRAAGAFPLPPGPWKLPIIGNIHQLAFSPDSALVHRRFAELAQQYGPVMQLQLGETANVVVSSPEAAREFLKTHEQNFSSRPFMPSASIIFYDNRDIAFSPEGEYWRRMRKICTTELLSERRVRSLRPIREDEIGKLVKLIGGSDGGMVNLSQLLISVANTMTSRAAFGKIRELEEGFLPLMHRITQKLGGFSLGDIFPSHRWLHQIDGTERELKKLHKEADAMLQEIIDEHVSRRSTQKIRETNEDDLVDVLLDCTDDHLEVKAVIMDVFLAGTDTSPTIVEWVMAELMKNPKEMEKVQSELRGVFDVRGKVIDEAYFDELHYFKAVIKETFRLHPPVPLSIPKEGREMVVVNGYQIPAKTRIIVNSWAIGRDPSHWTHPNQFIPQRFLDTSIDYKSNDFLFIPFGAGRRTCPGMNYGIAVVHLLLINLLYHFDWKLPNQIKSQDFDMSEEFGATVVRKNNLYLIPIPYQAL